LVHCVKKNLATLRVMPLKQSRDAIFNRSFNRFLSSHVAVFLNVFLNVAVFLNVPRQKYFFAKLPGGNVVITFS
jgi:hypothetical protein